MRPLFGNKSNKTTIAELEDYYASESDRRTARAWLMALLSIFVTIVIIIALFYGGRWLYRTVFSAETTDTTTTSQENGAVTINEDGSVSGDVSSLGQGSTSGAEGSASEAEGEVDSGAASTTRSAEEAAAATSGSGSTAGASTSVSGDDAIPDTGAGEVLVILPLIAAVAGYLYSRNRQLNR